MTTIIGMIYQSVAYLDFMLENMRGVDANRLIVANDATPQVKRALQDSGEPWLDYCDPKPNDFYLNRVYRAWNAGAQAAKSETIVFLNSDMYGAHGWLDNLLEHFNADTIPCCRLVESGKLHSGQHGIEKDFGISPDTFQREAFERYAKEIAEDRVEDGGLYMPCVFWRDEFLAAGGYPEGNVYAGGIGAYGTRFIRSGDDYFFHETMKHRRHITVFNSVCYHVQTGERDE